MAAKKKIPMFLTITDGEDGHVFYSQKELDEWINEMGSDLVDYDIDVYKIKVEKTYKVKFNDASLIEVK